MASWVWEIHYEGEETFVALCEVPTMYELMSGMVGKLFSLCIPGTYGLCCWLINFLDDKPKVLYKLPVTEEVLRHIDRDFL